MDSVLSQLAWLGEQDSERVSMFGPFLGRSLLELAATALIGRLDPLRVLVVRQVQLQPEYDAAIPWKSSIRWQGDVLAPKKGQGDVLAPKKGSGLWGDALEYEKITKALLGDYYDHLLWRPALQQMLGGTTAGGRWIAELSALPPDSFVSRKREEIGRLYSALSKGIHHEFVLPPGTLYDRATVVDLVQRVIHLVADVGFVSHFVPHAATLLSPVDAVAALGRIENVEVMK
ncbi:hypothetical protein OV207_17640 [Corallococcus sp. BB11-1]|uniref:hypothetical protein n=1 Tax=Corallococcus sp. BB11-1 TaxID=2996783 RepID=UPI002270EF6B|nr:hypothetical protein [Corallococcus sp. BB11-1]MCY1033281.1 hypothetical protein [Corallococcus sp. BB11-1]